MAYLHILDKLYSCILCQVIFNVTVRKRRLHFPAELPAPLRLLGKDCLAEEPAARPSFDQIVERLQTL